ncbi:MAG: hypothetical protein WD178_09215 [Actinomycetota bacterium]
MLDSAAVATAGPAGRRNTRPALRLLRCAVLGTVLGTVLGFTLAVALAGGASAAQEPPVDAVAPDAGITEEAMQLGRGRIETARSEMAARLEAAQVQVETAMQKVRSVNSQAPGIPAGNQLEPEHGTLYLLKSPAAAPATFTGRGGYSADGTSGPSGVLSADVPPGSNTEQAYLYAYFQTGTPTASQATVTFDGAQVNVVKLDDYASMTLSSARAEVTQQVASRVGTGSGITNFSAPTSLPVDGLALAVIYSNPALPERTIAIFDGAAQTMGDTATFTFTAPLDKSDPGFSARVSLGIGFSYQQGFAHQCGPGSPVSKQHSVVDINGTRLTSCAGGDDDAGTIGSLITVGGVGDSTDNPADPLQTPADGNPVRVTDDEFYDLEPFLTQGDTSLVVKTSQPSNDDILFLSIVQVDAPAQVTTEICGDGLDGDGDGLADENDPDCPGFVVTPPAGTEICNDGIDNDADGLADLLDSDCPITTVPEIVEPLIPPPVTGILISDPPPPTPAELPRAGKPVSGSQRAPVSVPSRELPRTGESHRLLLGIALALVLAGLSLDRSGSRRLPPNRRKRPT